ncbi:TolC family protein [Nguyenibacter sp. L1]|uniref:TolC family protein n=1 Tax=Nguyenibacter sp. L1 TaxID=3049350 RepID=UPI002B48C142|nr:TolC family protein [Nguyenibacter sp. L1]WRH88857.1 TolC family protein [Nguyenibacter sp. L1]
MVLPAGCATQALRSAPQRPDAPWRPEVAANGEILPGRASAHGLALPPGYVLPSNRAIRLRPAPADLQPAHRYALAELIDIAQSSNPVTRRAWNAARDAALAVGIARATYLPQLTVSVVGGYNETQDGEGLPGISGGGAAGQAANGVLRTAGGLAPRGSQATGSGEVQALGLEWLLFDFGKRDAIIDATRQDQVASNVLFTGAHQKLIYDVALAFYAHAAADARLVLVRQALDNAKQVEAAAEARLRQGQGTVVDTSQARQATAQAALRLVQAEGGAETAYLDLLTAMGISPATHLQTQDPAGRALELSDIRLSDDMVQRAVARRPDVLAAYAAAKASRSRVAAARAEFLPKVFVTGNVAYATGALALSSVPGVGGNAPPTLNLSTNHFSSLILGGIAVPIFDGGMRAAALKQAGDRADSADATLRQTLDEAARQVVVAQNGLRTALHAYDAAGRLRDAAQTSFDASLAAYRSGAGAVTPAIMAQSGLLDARLGRSDAYYGALIAAAGLAFATGALGDAPGRATASAMEADGP